WTTLADAPNKRDHASGVVVGDKLYVAGGRMTDLPNAWDKPVLPVDIYDFETGEWSGGTSMPTARAGAANTAIGNEIIVAGGEITGTDSAVSRVEAYNTVTNTWRQLADMKTGRHGVSAAVLGDRFHVTAGSTIRGGENTSIHESFLLTGTEVVDTDDDGLSDEEEVQNYGTDPSSADTDEDGLEDGREIELSTDPLVADTDNDGLFDGEEVDKSDTNPLSSDTDEDGLADGEEVNRYGTDPLNSDSDGDGLSDGEEVDGYGTDPLNGDSDEDGLSDSDEIDAGSDPLVAIDTDTGRTLGTDAEGSSNTDTEGSTNTDSGENTDVGKSTGDGGGSATDIGQSEGEGSEFAHSSSENGSLFSGAFSCSFIFLILALGIVRLRLCDTLPCLCIKAAGKRPIRLVYVYKIDVFVPC
ncbi:hypothetical protein N9383_07045, partial [Granulosicoccus sp.]|nr:hypothetical protein [Granulosicoccus sp.]